MDLRRKSRKGIAVTLFCLVLAVLLAACRAEKEPVMNNNAEFAPKPGFHIITQDEAAAMMEKDDGHVLVDVRRQDEYDEGHIPGAILIPNESITDTPPEELPDPDQIILIYCRSGRRSKEAAAKLAEMGYTQLYEFGGIITWTGDIVQEQKSAALRFDSFDGGGPVYKAVLEDPSLVAFEERTVYFDADHEELDGASYTVDFVFTGLRSGETRLRIEERSPIAGDMDYEYTVRVDDALNVAIEELTASDPGAALTPSAVLVIDTGSRILYAGLEDNPSAEAFRDMLSHGEIEVEMQDYGGFEKVGSLPWALPQTDELIATEPGDITLYQGNKISLYYDENSWELTRLASIGNITKDELLEALGEGSATVSFWIEWDE